MRRGVHRIDEPLEGVRREVDRDARAGRDAAGDLDVEGNLAVGLVAGAFWPPSTETATMVGVGRPMAANAAVLSDA